MIDVLPIAHQFSNSWYLFFTDDPLSRFRIKTLELPFVKLDYMNKESTGQKFYSKPIYQDTFSIEIYESLTFETYTYFKAWKDSIFNPITQTFNILPLTRTAIFIWTTQFTEVPVKKIILSDLKLLGIEPLSLSYETGDPLTYNVSFAIGEIIE